MKVEDLCLRDRAICCLPPLLAMHCLHHPHVHESERNHAQGMRIVANMSDDVFTEDLSVRILRISICWTLL